MKQYFVILFVLLLAFNQTNAQDKEIKWGKINKEDFEHTVCPIDEDASAMVLFDIGKVDFDIIREKWRIRKYRHKRIKIYDEKGLDQASIEIPFYSYKEKSEIESIEAQSIAPDGTITKLKKKDIFIIKSNKYWSKATFAIPNVQKGHIIEFKYQMLSENLSDLNNWYFQSDIPTQFSQLKFKKPVFFEYVYLTYGNKDFEVKERTATAHAKKYADYYNDREDIYTFTHKNLPAFETDRYIATKDDYISRIVFQLRTITYDAGNVVKNFTSWENLQKELLNHEMIGKMMHPGPAKKLLKNHPEFDQGDTDKEKMLNAFNLLKTSVVWDEYIGFSASKGIHKVLEDKSGNLADINYGLISILKHIGLQAFPILTSTRSNGKCIQEYPLLDQFNYIVAGVKIGDEIFFLDASSPYNMPNLINKSALNKMGWFFTKEEQGWLKMLMEQSSRYKQEDIVLNENGSFEINLKDMSQGYFAIGQFKNIAKQEGKDKYKFEYGEEIELTDHEIDDSRIQESKLNENVKFVIENEQMQKADMIYFDLAINKFFDENPFKAKSRNHPIDFHFPNSTTIVSNFTIPDGWEIESIPESFKFDLGAKQLLKYRYVVKQNGQKVRLERIFSIKEPIISAKNYEHVKEYFETIVQNEKQQLILKKAK